MMCNDFHQHFTFSIDIYPKPGMLNFEYQMYIENAGDWVQHGDGGDIQDRETHTGAWASSYFKVE